MSRTMDVLRALPASECIGRAALAGALAKPPPNLAVLLRRLMARGLVEAARPGCYRITRLGAVTREAGAASLHTGKRLRAPVPRRPKRRTIADAVWWHMRAERAATLDALLALLDRDPPPATEARKFLTALARAGYVSVDRRKRPHRFVLLQNTGPAAPLVDAARGRLWDPNTRAFVAFAQ